MKKENLVEIYQGENGSLNIRIDNNKQTIWANQNEIAKIFNVNIRTINDHINNIFETNEMDRSATIRKFRLVQKEGKRMVQREIEYYNLDVVLSVGYRVNSKNAIKFRQWATNVLHKHIVDGWTINENRIKNNYNENFFSFNIFWIPAFAGMTITDSISVIPAKAGIQKTINQICNYFLETILNIKGLLFDRNFFSINDWFNFTTTKIKIYE